MKYVSINPLNLVEDPDVRVHGCNKEGCDNEGCDNDCRSRVIQPCESSALRTHWRTFVLQSQAPLLMLKAYLIEDPDVSAHGCGKKGSNNDCRHSQHYYSTLWYKVRCVAREHSHKL